MKVYVVTSGEYSNYHIDAIFTDEKIANQYANLDSDRNVEEYETDIDSIESDPNKLVYSVDYNFIKNKIETLCLTSAHNICDDSVNDVTLTDFYFYVSPSETLDASIRTWGMNSDWLLKIAQDRFYMYCDAHGISARELQEKKKKRDEEFARQYPMYRTSMPTATNAHDPGCFNPYWHANNRMPDLMNKYFDEHGAFPDVDTINKMYAEQVEEVKREHVD